MPKLPMPPTNEESYKKNTKEQYEALGAFVEAFERLVHEVRESSIALIERDGRHTRLVEVVLHHQVLTAKPLFDIFRALIMEIIDDAIKADKEKAEGLQDLDPPLATDVLGEPLHFTIAERDTFFGVMAAISTEYERLNNRRNELLHATWFIGFVGNDDPNASEFYVRKFTTTKKGLVPVDLPKNAGQLKELSDRCEEATNWIAWLHSCVTGPDKILERFESSGSKWWLVNPGGNKTTFPDK
jgi:hypothetical protein